MKGQCIFCNFFSTYKRGCLIRHQNLRYPCRHSPDLGIYIWRPGQLPIGQTAKARSGYRVQSLRKGRDRQCRTHPINAVSPELVKIALPFYSAGGFDENRATPNAKMTGLRMMVPRRRPAAHARCAILTSFQQPDRWKLIDRKLYIRQGNFPKRGPYRVVDIQGTRNS